MDTLRHKSSSIKKPSLGRIEDNSEEKAELTEAYRVGDESEDLDIVDFDTKPSMPRTNNVKMVNPSEDSGIRVNKLDLNREEKFVPSPKKSLKPGIDFGLDLLTNNRVKDVSDLSTEGVYKKQTKYHSDRHSMGGARSPPQEELDMRAPDLRAPDLRAPPEELDLQLSDDDHKHDVIEPSELSTIPGDNRGSPEDGKRFMDWLNPKEFHGSEQDNNAELSELQQDSQRRKYSRLSPHEIYVRKRTALKKLERLKRKGFQPSQAYTMRSSLQDIEDEVDSLEEERSLETSIRLMQMGLNGCASGLELFNHIYNPCDLELDGFSQHVYENTGNYDDIFEELYFKYKDDVSLPPELKLLGMFFGSAILFHISKHYAKNIISETGKKVPDFEHIMTKYPEVRKAYQQAASQEMGSYSAPPPSPSNWSQAPNMGMMGNIMQMMSQTPVGNIMNMFTGNQQQQAPRAPQYGFPMPSPNEAPPQPRNMPPPPNRAPAQRQQATPPPQPPAQRPQAPPPQPSARPQAPPPAQSPQAPPVQRQQTPPQQPPAMPKYQQKQEILGPQDEDILGELSENRLETVPDPNIKSISVTGLGGRRTKKAKRAQEE